METQPQLRQLRNNTTMLFNNQNQPVESVETSVMYSPVTEEENPFIEAKNTPIVEVVNSENKPKHFIEANTKEVSLYHLKMTASSLYSVRTMRLPYPTAGLLKPSGNAPKSYLKMNRSKNLRSGYPTSSRAELPKLSINLSRN